MNIVIYGTGGLAREVHQLLEDIYSLSTDKHDGREFIGFIDDDISTHGTCVHDHHVLGGIQWLVENQDTMVFVGVGSPAARRRIVNQIRQAAPDVEFPKLIHPSAIIGDRVKIGDGTIICAGNIVTTDIRIGKHVIVNLDCTVGHDTQIDDFVTIAPSANVSGNVHLHEGCDLGTNCTLIQGMSVGQWSVLGAGAVVVRDIPNNATAVGNPAKVIKQRETGWHL